MKSGSMRTGSRAVATALAIGLSIAAAPARAAESGTVDADVTVAATACLQLSTTSVSFGTLPLGAEDRAATPGISVTNCSGGSETVLARGTDATAPVGTWTLDDSSLTCGSAMPLPTNRYHLRLVHGVPTATVSLSTTNKTIQTLGAGASSSHSLRIFTACPGSTGVGQTMSMQVVYVATVS